MSDLLGKLASIKERHEAVALKLSDPEIIADMKKYVKLNREYSELESLVKIHKQYSDMLDNLASAKEILQTESDPEMKEMAKEELNELEAAIPALEDDIKIMLIPKDPEDVKNVMLEIRS